MDPGYLYIDNGRVKLTRFREKKHRKDNQKTKIENKWSVYDCEDYRIFMHWKTRFFLNVCLYVRMIS